MTRSGPPYPDWRDSSWPWIAKLDRAKHHIETLRTELTEFHDRAYSVTYERGDVPEATVIRLHISKPVPVQFSTMIGDAIHNMRSSLDALAYELARRHVGGVLTPDQEARTRFPIFRQRADFDKFFAKRTDIYGLAEREALDSVAPGWMWDGIGPAQATEIIGPREDDVTEDLIWQLNNLWTIDKHRRLHFAVWWPEDLYWVSEQNAEHGWIPGRPPWVDGAVIGTIVAAHGREPIPGVDVTATFELRMVEDGVNNAGIAEALLGIHSRLWGWTFPRAFQVYEAKLAAG